MYFSFKIVLGFIHTPVVMNTKIIFLFQNLDGSATVERPATCSLTSTCLEATADTISGPKDNVHSGASSVTPTENAAQGGGGTIEAATPEAAKVQESPLKRPNRRSDEGGKDRRPRKV